MLRIRRISSGGEEGFPVGKGVPARGLVFLCALASVSVLAGDLQARSPGTSVRLMQKVRPGRQIRYAVREQRVAQTLRETHQTRFVWGRSGQWTLYFLGGDSGQNPKVAEQMTLDAGQPGEYERDGRRVDVAGEGAVLPTVPPAGCRFLIRSVDPSSVPVVLPTDEPFERLAYRLALDHLSWPAGPVVTDKRYSQPIEWDGFTGERVFRVTDVRRVDKHRRATVTVAMTGRFSHRFSGRPTLQSAHVSLRWDLTSQCLLGMVSEIRFERRYGKTKREVVLRLTVERLEEENLSPQARQAARDALIDLAEMVVLLRQKQYAEVSQRAEEFKGTYGETVWLPTATYLAAQADARSEASEPLPLEALVKALTTATVNWQSSARTGDLTEEELSRRVFEELNRKNRDDLVRLARGEDTVIRSMATFALGFGTVPADLVAITASARHANERVRAWAAYAMAIRGAPDVETDLLAALLTDEDAQVRTRACQAVGASVRPSSEDAARFRTALIERLADEAATVRREAAEALGMIGTAADVSAIQAAVERELDADTRDAMSRAIARLRHR